MRWRLFLTLWLLIICLGFPQPAHADPITAILISIGVSASVAGAITTGIVTAVVGAVVSFGISAIVGAVTKPKGRSAGSFAADAGSRLQISRSAVESYKIIYGRARVSGPMVYVGATDKGTFKNGYLHMAIALAGHQCTEIESIYIDDAPVTLDADGYVTTTKYMRRGHKYIRVKSHLGTADQVADPLMVSEIKDWTDKHRLRGITYIYVRLEYQQQLFPNGVPQISAIVKGKPLYDPRDGSTAYSVNPALAIRDYLTSTAYGLGATAAEIDDATFIASANNCEELVTLADASTQKRYTCNGVVDTASKPIDVLKDLCTAMAGTLPYVQGRFRCFSGYYSAPTISMDASWLAGEIEIQAKKPRNELFNAVKGVFADPDKNWQPTDFPMVTNTTYEAQDGSVRIVRDLELPFTINSVEAQRIAKIALEQGRQGIMVKAPCNYKALQLSIYDTVSLTLDQLGWSSKVFRVTQWELNLDGGFTVGLQEEASANYDWNNGEQTSIDPAPDTNLPDLFTCEPPGNPVVTEELYATTDGSGIKTKAILTWAESPHTFVDRYEVDYKLTSNADYIPAGSVSYKVTTITIPDIAPGLYDFRVQAINVRGVESDYATTTTEVFGLTTPPADITDFAMVAINNQAHLSWRQVSDLDVRIGGYIRLRWSSRTSGASWSDGVDLGDALPGIATQAVFPLVNGTYMVKAYDSTGHESLNATMIATNVVNILNMNAVATSDQHPAFSGQKTSMISDAGTLSLDGAIPFDSVSGDFDDAPGDFDVSAGTGFAASGIYVFDTYLDTGAVYNARVTLGLEASVYDASENFDSATGLFDDREGLFSGTDLANTSLKAWIKTTTVDPATATDPTDPDDPIWSEWQRFVVGDFTARAYWAKIEVTNETASNNIAITELSLSVDVPDRDERFEDRAILSGGSTITYAKPFFGKPQFGITIQGTASGDTPNYTHITSGGLYTGVTVQILNGGSGVARTIDLVAKAY